jgi:hypothetical protein
MEGIMSLANYISTLDITSGTEVKDYSSYFYRKPLPGGEAKLYSLLSKREDAQGDTITWFEDADVPVTAVAVDSADGDLTASEGDTNLVFASGTTAASFLRVGMQLRDTADGSDEIIELVTDGGSQSWTITRAVGTSSAEVHSRAATWEIIGTPQYQGSGFGTPVGANRVARTNTMSILDEQIKLTRSQLRQVMYAVSSNWVWTLERALRHFERIKERHILWSRGVARAGSAGTQTAAGTCKGIVDLIEQYGSASLQTTDFGTWKYTAIDEVLCDFWDRGYDDSTDLVILIGATGVRATGYWNQSAIRTTTSDTTRGMRATHILSGMGHLVPMIPVAGLGDRFIVCPLEKIALRYVDTMLAYDIKLGEAGNDFAARRFISEFTVELHDADKAFYLGEGVDYVFPED